MIKMECSQFGYVTTVFTNKYLRNLISVNRMARGKTKRFDYVEKKQRHFFRKWISHDIWSVECTAPYIDTLISNETIYVSVYMVLLHSTCSNINFNWNYTRNWACVMCTLGRMSCSLYGLWNTFYVSFVVCFDLVVDWLRKLGRKCTTSNNMLNEMIHSINMAHMAILFTTTRLILSCNVVISMYVVHSIRCVCTHVWRCVLLFFTCSLIVDAIMLKW